MKRAKVRRLVRDVLAEQRLLDSQPVTFDVLEIDYANKTFTVRGSKVQVGPDATRVSIPLLTTDRAVITEGRVL